VNIKFTSTLTSDDENRVAPALLAALGCLLNTLPIAYRIRIDTVDSKVYELTGPDDSVIAPSEPLRFGHRNLTTFDS
jgi:hypothetical protein